MTTPSTLENELLALSIVRDYRFDNAIGDDLIDYGNGASLADLVSDGTGGTAGIAGQTTYEDDNFAIDMATTRRYTQLSFGVEEITLPSGAIFANFKMNSGWDTSRMTIFGFGGSGGGITWRLEIFNRELNVTVRDGTGPDQITWTADSNPIGSGDTDWHTVLVSQPGDGTGVDFYIDGVAVPVTTTTLGTFGNDDWFDTIAALDACRHCVGAWPGTGFGNPFDGTLARITITGSAVANSAQAMRIHQATSAQNNTYSEINSVSGGPEHWWRFTNGGNRIDDQGTATRRHLTELSTTEGAFNGTYQAEANPAGDGFGMQFNGQGGMVDTSSALALAGSLGTIVVAFRTDGGTLLNSDRIASLFGGNNRLELGITSSGYPQYRINDGASDENLWELQSAIDDDLVHTLAVSPASGAGTTPILFLDGLDVSGSLVHTDTDPVDNDLWWDDFIEQAAVGYKGDANNSSVDGVIVYEVVIFDGNLTSSQVRTVHNALLGIMSLNFSSKTVRRNNRRVYSANLL